MKDSKGRIAVVDDDREMRILLEDFLISEGYQVVAFPLATEALQALSPGGSLSPDRREGDIDVIL